MNNEALDRLDAISLFDGIDRAAITTERLGGLTNRNYKIVSPVGRYVLRLAGEGTEEYASSRCIMFEMYSSRGDRGPWALSRSSRLALPPLLSFFVSQNRQS